jgi:hypothetical protein
LNNLKDAPIHPCVCVVIDDALEKKEYKYIKQLVKLNHYCVKVVIHFFKNMKFQDFYSQQTFN